MQAFKSRTVIFTVVLVVIISALVFWLSTTSDNQLVSAEQNKQTMDVKTPSAQQNKQAASVEDLLANLEQKLQNQPDNMQGWLLLAKSYRYLQRDSAAQSALEKAQALGFKGTLDVAQTDASRKPNPVDQLSTPLPMNDLLQNYLVKNTTKSKNSGRAKTHSIAKNTGSILLRVSLSEALTQTVSPDTTVFIFVRPYINQQIVAGPPLAAVRKQVRDLPLYIALNDQMAMLPDHNISSTEQVVVGARLAISGNPVKQAGDIEEISQAVSTATQPTVSLVISNVFAAKSQG
ncbi:hypothetical protein [Paraglaciecola sp. MB-3u-78]|jgi:cytochrome c-type biogenesis protein CcmH|uniref:c-type cytochrome biogenesis protein CcmI/CycH n=1 Tax=Paraglaciecola sp. MB-3u-78 TaxID=2058332 RepID=UPI000C33557B|nr:hypothetical protein [Paraglaciecola sp. MB-3u-78]PKG99130.1 hypothetical protein CXF95_07480 [Paraglaciecola sp. MB-3u-78]